MSIMKPDFLVKPCLMDGYSQYLINKKLSPTRAKMYVNFVRKFYNCIGKSYIDIERHDIINYLSFLLENGHLQENSLYRHLVAIKKFFEYLKSRGDVAMNPCGGVNIKSCKFHRLSDCKNSDEE